MRGGPSNHTLCHGPPIHTGKVREAEELERDIQSLFSSDEPKLNSTQSVRQHAFYHIKQDQGWEKKGEETGRRKGWRRRGRVEREGRRAGETRRGGERQEEEARIKVPFTEK